MITRKFRIVSRQVGKAFQQGLLLRFQLANPGWQPPGKSGFGRILKLVRVAGIDNFSSARHAENAEDDYAHALYVYMSQHASGISVLPNQCNLSA